MRSFKNLSISEKTAGLLCILIAATRFCLSFEHVLSWDVFGYYLYLPSQFIYNDIGLHDLTWLHKIMVSYEPSSTLYQINILPDGHCVMRYPCGQALLNGPFFLMGHLWARLFHFPADGFSAPYNISYALGGVFYSLLGIFFFQKLLTCFFDERISALLFVLIVTGTNYFEQATLQNTLTHNFLFTLYAILIYNTVKWHLHFKNKNALFAGLAAGLITITRANEIVCVLIPIVWSIYDIASLKVKIQHLIRSKKSVLLFVAGLLSGLAPQLIYWRLYTGQWIYYSYEDPGVGFEFGSPFILQFLFSFRKGWFLYTPLMVFALIGFYSMYKKNKSAFWPILIYSVINLYIVSSWSMWWYAGGSFSSRSMVSSYALLAIPLGYLLVQNYKKGLLILLSLFVFLNLFQTWQSHTGILSNDRMTRAYYFSSFGKLSASEKDKKLLLIHRPTDPIEIMPDTINFVRSRLSALESFTMDSSNPFTPALKLSYATITRLEYAWIRASAEVSISDSSGKPELPILVMHFTNKDGKIYNYKTSGGRKTVAGKDGKTKIEMDYMTPEVRNNSDLLNVYLWYRGNRSLLVNDFVIDKYEPVK